MFSLRCVFLLLCVICGTTSQLCSFATDRRPAVELTARIGERLTMRTQFNGQNPAIIRWTQGVTNPFTGVYEEQILVSYIGGNNSYSNNVSPLTHAAMYRLDNGVTTYELQLVNITCDSEGLYKGEFIGTSNDCVSEYNVSVVASPQLPIMQNVTIRGNADETVNIVCKANIGYPAGDIWWYYKPADGSNNRRIIDGISVNITNTTDCRQEMTSTLRVQLREFDHNSQFICRSVSWDSSNLGNFVSQARVAIFGLEDQNCQGQYCSSGHGLTSALVGHFVFIFVALFVL